MSSRHWEEMIAAAFHEAKFDEVILTPQSGDHGRDVIAISDFPAGIQKDPLIAPLIPYRLELMNGSPLRRGLKELQTPDVC